MKRNDAIRLEILTHLYATRPYDRPTLRIVNSIRTGDDLRDLLGIEAERELDYLLAQGWVEKVPVEPGEDKRWKISAAGIDHLEKQGWV